MKHLRTISLLLTSVLSILFLIPFTAIGMISGMIWIGLKIGAQASEDFINNKGYL